MLPLIYTNPIAAIVFLAVCLVWLIPEMVGMAPQMAKISRRSAIIEDKSSLWILIGLQWIGLALNFLLGWIFPAAAITWQRMVIFALAMIAIFSGTALRWYAIVTLGRYFTRDVAVTQRQAIVKHGPYRIIRHPAYSGTLITMLGVGLALANWASLIVLLTCVMIGHLYRVRVEEKALIKAIGEPYIEYMHHTRRFIPLLF